MQHVLPIVGRLGDDPVVRTNSNTGKDFVTFSVAVDDGKKGSEYHKTVWHDCVANGKIGENIAETFTKGMAVVLLGKVSQRKRKATIDGVERNIIQNSFAVYEAGPSLAFASAEVTANPFEDSEDEAPARKPAAKSSAKPAARKAPAKAAASTGGDFDDDF